MRTPTPKQPVAHTALRPDQIAIELPKSRDRRRPELGGSLGEPHGRRGNPRRSFDPSIRSSWTSARCAGARAKRGAPTPRRPRRRPEPPVAEGRSDPLAPGIDEAPHLVHQRERRRIQPLHLATTSVEERRQGGVDARAEISGHERQYRKAEALRRRDYHACVAMPVSRSRFRTLALATAIATVVLFAIGGLVRGTGSGLGCSTWPGCEPGRLFPSGTVHSLIEFSHRGMAFLVSVLSALTGLAAIRSERRDPSVLWPAVLAFPLVMAQAGLGAVVVATDLDPWWVTAHFVVALLLIADVTYVAACAAMTPSARDERHSTGCSIVSRRLALVTARSSDSFFGWAHMSGRAMPLVFTDWR